MTIIRTFLVVIRLDFLVQLQMTNAKNRNLRIALKFAQTALSKGN